MEGPFRLIQVGEGIIFNEIVIDKSVFRMVLLIDVKYFNLKKVPLFLSLVLTRLEQN